VHPPEVVHVYFDYLCPFAWRGAELAEQVAEPLGLSFEWHHFSLYQSLYSGGDYWQLWNDRLELESDSGCRGLLPFLASCAARKQGKACFDRFRLGLMRARYGEHRPLSYATILAVAEGVGLELYRFKHDLSDPERRTELAHEHYRATALEILSTPTYRFENGHLAHLRLKDLPRSQDEAVRLFSDYRRLLECYPYIETIQRPRAKVN
jgi:predicted DsbA family dithiol-disulfide isomerase